MKMWEHNLSCVMVLIAQPRQHTRHAVIHISASKSVNH
jgi:hypothetical protein